MPKTTNRRPKRYLLPPQRPAKKLDEGCRGCGVLRTTHPTLGRQDLQITSKTAFWIGRRADCDYVVDDAFVSRRHLKVSATRNETDDAVVYIVDVSSSNGILFNGKTPRSKSIIVTDGDVIELPGASTTFTYIRIPSASKPKTLSLKEVTTLPWAEIEKHAGRKKRVRTIGQYEIDLETRLGSGTFGDVHLAWDALNEIQVACKFVPHGKMHNGKDRDRQLTENELGMAFQHPNLMSVFRFTEFDDGFYSFLRLATGGDLFSYVAKHGGLEQSETKYLLYQILRGVKFMHAQGSAHRDLKLENIFLKSGGSYPTLLVGDFGLATPLPATAEGSSYPASPAQLMPSPPVETTFAKSRIAPIRSPSVVGTVTYFPPEYLLALKNEKVVKSAAGRRGHRRGGDLLDATKSDSWAIGIMAYVLATGNHPFGNEDDAGDGDAEMTSDEDGHGQPTGAQLTPFQQAVCSGELHFPSGMRSTWDRAALDLIEKLLDPNVDSRFTVSDALDHAWFEMDRVHLEKLYQLKVIEESVDAFGSPRGGSASSAKGKGEGREAGGGAAAKRTV